MTSIKKIAIPAAASLAILFGSCGKFNELDARMERIENSVDSLADAMGLLKAAYADGKIITAVNPVETEPGGWKFVFSDGQEINVMNGSDAMANAAIYLKAGNDGIWNISSDNGKTFVKLRNSNGAVIVATGRNARCVRAVPGEDGFCHIQTYLESAPDEVIDEITTDIPVDDSGFVSYLIKNNQSRSLSFVTAEGSEFTFSMKQDMASGIVILSNEPVRLTPGYQASVEFRVNPSTAAFKIAGKECQVRLDKIGNVISKASFVNVPENYDLVAVEQVYDDYTGVLKEGQYRAVIQDMQNTPAYHETVALVLELNDGVCVSSPVFEIVGSDGGPLHTNLPVVTITTPKAIESKEEWVEESSMTIQNVDNSIDFEGKISIKGRGNSTWWYPKKPYAVKLDRKSEILGMPAHKRWVLLANWMDRTIIRNAVTFEISRKSGLEWTPRGQFVEVVLNGRHIGNYYLCEQIKVDPNRVNVSEDGGQLMELDVAYDEMYKFYATRSGLPWMFKDPDEVSDEQFDAIRGYVSDMEDAIYDDTRFRNFEYADYLDLDSVADWFIVNELAMNGEVNHPKSCYFSKEVGGKFKAGPVWDFDWGTYNPGNTGFFCSTGGLYYGRLMKDARFKAILKERWNRMKPALENEIPLYIDYLKEYLQKSEATNHALWRLDDQTTNGDESLTFNQAVERLRHAYLDKLAWMDREIGRF